MRRFPFFPAGVPQGSRKVPAPVSLLRDNFRARYPQIFFFPRKDPCTKKVVSSFQSFFYMFTVSFRRGKINRLCSNISRSGEVELCMFAGPASLQDECMSSPSTPSSQHRNITTTTSIMEHATHPSLAQIWLSFFIVIACEARMHDCFWGIAWIRLNMLSQI